jgi:hypothetical protein
MNLLEIVLLAIFFLYAIILHRALTNIELNDRKAEFMYNEVCGYVEDLRQRHNSLIESQKDFSKYVLESVEKTLEDADNKRLELDKSFFSELERVKQVITQGFLRR